MNRLLDVIATIADILFLILTIALLPLIVVLYVISGILDLTYHERHRHK